MRPHVTTHVDLTLTVLDGDQNFFPVYEPDADVIKQKYREAEEAARAHHYDSTKEGMSLPHNRSPTSALHTRRMFR